MNEEAYLEERYTAVLSPLDEELIEKYCSGMEEKIRLARHRKEAELIVHDACREFENLCENDALVTFLKRHVFNVFQEFWGEV